MTQHSNHLNEEQFVAWAGGERDEQVAQHLRDCAECLAEVRELNTALEGFKAELKQQAEVRLLFPASRIRALAAEPKRASSFWKLVPVPALAAAAMLAALLYKPAPVEAPPAKPQQTVAANDEADNALLLAIDSDVYRAAPSALTPAASIAKERNQLLNTASQKKK